MMFNSSARHRSTAGLVVAALLAALSVPVSARSAGFRRGDANCDAATDLSDAVFTLRWIFSAGTPPCCLDSADANDDGGVDVSDPIFVLLLAFAGGSEPLPPFADCGDDPTSDGIGCAGYPPCAPADSDPEIREWTVPWANSRPRDPHVDAEGRVWFVGQLGDYAAWLDPASGTFTRHNLPAGAGPHNCITTGGFVWYAGNGDAHIGKLGFGGGAVEVIPMPDTAARDPHTLIANSAGDIWFTVQQGNFVGRLEIATAQVRLVRVPTAGARPYGIDLDSQERPWICEFGSNKLALLDPATLTLREFTLPRGGARPRRLAVTSDDAVWYVDFSGGFLGRLEPASGAVREWLLPDGTASRPYGMAADDRDRLWIVETGVQPNRLVGFSTADERFFSDVPIPSGGDTVRHMYFHLPSREIWFGTDANTIGRARLLD